MLSSVVASQVADHRPYGGVVPEIAGRKHLENLVPVVQSALDEAGVAPADLGAVAVTSSPGLMGALLVGTSFGKALALGWGVPLVEVNHLHAHALAIFLGRPRARACRTSRWSSPAATRRSFASPRRWIWRSSGRRATTPRARCIDKVAKFLGLGYPGGPEIDRLAAGANPRAVRFPRGLAHAATLDFSFSGLKTAVVNHVLGTSRLDGPLNHQQPPALPDGELRDLVASFLEAVVDTLVGKTLRAAREHGLSTVVVSGGVAANTRLREKMTAAGQAAGVRVLFPGRELCTDNAAMIAGAAWHLARSGALRGAGPAPLGEDEDRRRARMRGMPDARRLIYLDNGATSFPKPPAVAGGDVALPPRGRRQPRALGAPALAGGGARGLRVPRGARRAHRRAGLAAHRLHAQRDAGAQHRDLRHAAAGRPRRHDRRWSTTR